MARRVAYFVAIALGAVGSNAATFIDSKDTALAAAANDKAEKVCKRKEGMKLDEEDRKSIKEDLVAASADNVILRVLEASDTASDMSDQMREKIFNAGFFIPKAGALVTAFVLIGIFFPCICWTAWPCCKCMRCCKKERSVSKVVKIIFLVVVLAIILALVISASLAMRGFNSANDGFEVTNCAAALMVNTTLSGQQNPEFLGLIPTLQTFESMKDSLDANSAFIRDLKSTLSNTKKISDAVIVASGTLKLLQETVSAPENKQPVSNSGSDLLHECSLCSHLETSLTPAIEALDGSVGSALDKARDEVNKQLTGDKLSALQQSMITASEPLIQLKGTMHSAFGMFVETDTMETLSKSTDSYGSLVAIVLILFALLLAACGGSATGIWLCCEKRNNADGAAEYRRHTHRCACVTWCGACHYAILAFIVGGIMTMVSIPLASICLVMEDVSKDMLMDISGPLNLDLSGAKGEMMVNMVEQCFRNKDPNANPALLDIIMMTENGTDISMREKLVGQTKDQIDAQFDKISSSMGSATSAPKINDDPKIVALKTTLRETRMSAMTVPRQAMTEGANANIYGPIANEASLKNYALSSADCADFTVPAGMPQEGSVVPGISSFSGALTAFGTQVASLTCAKKVICDDGPTTARGKSCEAANSLMDLKQGLLASGKFKCFRFKNSGGFACDVKAMRETSPGSGTYTNDCLVNGKMVSESYDCTLSEFTTLVSDFDTRLDNVFKRLDGATDAVMNDINVGMRNLVDEYVIDPVTSVADGLTCGFLGQTYQHVLDGMCYGGVWGFKAMASAYVFCASVTLVLAIVMYVVWRIALDNVNAQCAEASPRA
eukprot:TRINITY_DN3912_c0_g2_i2.p1 TRINITY_DN3912_c0_g2~~TRINITY_DN3912_c0_g2_i2.p1  ORF type:complete len:838 (-),score=183.26 TRINITY_DN3912_c0_g2_i2:94-2607(-)